MPEPTSPTRRTVLAGAAAVGAGGLLAACGGSSDPATAPGTTTPPTTPAPSPTGSPTGGPTSTPTATAPSTVEGVVALADVPVGGGVVLDAEKLVVTQPTAGTVKGYSAVCTHQGCLVSRVGPSGIYCPCHGSLFSAEDGSVLQGPAERPLPEEGVTIESGQVVRT